MPSEYDVGVIREQADLLNAEADRAAIVATILGGLLGVFVGGASFYFLSERNEAVSIILALGVPIASAAVGAILGESRALKLQAQAQQLMILLAIERNTHREPSSQSHVGG